MGVAVGQSNLVGASVLEAMVRVRPVGRSAASPWPAWLRLRGKEGALFITGVFLLWQLVSTVISFSGHYLFPSPLLTARTLWLSLPELLLGTGYSFLILAPSLALAISLGVLWGMLVGTAPALNRMFSPFARFVSPVPPTIYIPYARILGLRHGEYLRRVVFPATLPHIFAGISIGLVFAFIMLTVAEQLGASNGIGRFVQLYADYADYPRMVAGILYTGVVVWISMEVLECIKKRALFWLK